jgi:hypothetical protein
MNAQTQIPPSDQAAKLEPVEAKQGTDAPKGMPIVLIVGIVGAAVGMWIVWSMFF